MLVGFLTYETQTAANNGRYLQENQLKYMILCNSCITISNLIAILIFQITFFSQVTGANKILLFYTTLKEKTVKTHPNKKSVSCLNLNDFPREITNAAIQILNSKAENDRLAIIEANAENETTAELKKDMQRLEDKLDKIMNALRISQ